MHAVNQVPSMFLRCGPHRCGCDVLICDAKYCAAATGPPLHSAASRSTAPLPTTTLCSDRNQESGIPAGILLRNGPCQVRFRNSRFQELPRGVPWLWYFPVRSGGVVTVPTCKKNSGANRDGAEERSVPCPHNPRSLQQTFNGIEQNEKMKCCGQQYWDFTPSKILEHFGLQSTRETAAKSLTGARVLSST
jgi:hypothetical protein